MKKLSQLIDCQYDIDILGVTDDSRLVEHGFLFVATKGFYVDHKQYINDAICNGAVAIVCDSKIIVDIPVIVVDDVNKVFIELNQRFFDVNPCEFSLIGVTGTDGKTTTTTIIQTLLNGISKTALIGTNGLTIDEDNIITNNTTPCVSEMYSCLNMIKNRQCKSLVMEVSSEALLHKRLNSFEYDIVGYTNITEDHLNVHKNIENYVKTKISLLQNVKSDGIVVVNGDDKNCKSIKCKKMYTYGFETVNDFVIFDVREMSNCVNFSVKFNDSIYHITSNLIGSYNVYNVTLAFAICLLKGINSDYLIDEIAKIKSIEGRRELLDFGQDYKIILDYAHTYNGVKSIFDSIKCYKNKKIITVIGAAGGREKEKRSLIGKFVLENSNITIFTMDDPRYEDVNDIIDQLAGDSNDYLRIIDRKEAIFKALSIADEDFLVLILGKGRDNYMAIGDKRIPYCDYDVICNYFDK